MTAPNYRDPHEPFDEDYEVYDGERERCPVCHGTGYVHELTQPAKYAPIAGYNDCPVCDGSGEQP